MNQLLGVIFIYGSGGPNTERFKNHSLMRTEINNVLGLENVVYNNSLIIKNTLSF